MKQTKTESGLAPNFKWDLYKLGEVVPDKFLDIHKSFSLSHSRRSPNIKWYSGHNISIKSHQCYSGFIYIYEETTYVHKTLWYFKAHLFALFLIYYLWRVETISSYWSCCVRAGTREVISVWWGLSLLSTPALICGAWLMMMTIFHQHIAFYNIHHVMFGPN